MIAPAQFKANVPEPAKSDLLALAANYDIFAAGLEVLSHNLGVITTQADSLGNLSIADKTESFRLAMAIQSVADEMRAAKRSAEVRYGENAAT